MKMTRMKLSIGEAVLKSRRKRLRFQVRSTEIRTLLFLKVTMARKRKKKKSLRKNL